MRMKLNFFYYGKPNWDFSPSLSHEEDKEISRKPNFFFSLLRIPGSTPDYAHEEDLSHVLRDSSVTVEVWNMLLDVFNEPIVHYQAQDFVYHTTLPSCNNLPGGQYLENPQYGNIENRQYCSRGVKKLVWWGSESQATSVKGTIHNSLKDFILIIKTNLSCLFRPQTIVEEIKWHPREVRHHQS